MAIKVIEKRTPPAEKPIRTECDKCTSVLEVAKTDCQVQYDRNEIIYRYGCPVCGKDNWLDSRVFK